MTRGPEYRRPKRRGDGFTTEASRVHLQRRDGAAWASLSANKAEAGELIAELVGLTRAQFTQVMLLPQGEFARFLRSSDDHQARAAQQAVRHQPVRQDHRRTCARAGPRRPGPGIRPAGRSRLRCRRRPRRRAWTPGSSAELLAAARAERQTQLKELDESLAQAIAATGAALAAAAGSLSAAQAEEEEARRQAGLMTRLTRPSRTSAHTGHPAGSRRAGGPAGLARHAEPVRPLLEAARRGRGGRRGGHRRPG